jgi:hypothetical protein
MDQFTVELGQLDNLGGKYLPGIGQRLHDALCDIRNACGWIHRAFSTRDSYNESGPALDAGQPSTRYLYFQPGNECYYTTDLMRQVFEDNRDNIGLAAQAIIEIGRRYRQADGQPDATANYPGVTDHAPEQRGPDGVDYDADFAWDSQMSRHAEALVGLLREHDDDGIGAAAHLDTRLRRIFDLFSSGDDACAQVMIHYLSRAKTTLIQDEHHLFGGAEDCLKGWQGAAADQFEEYLRDVRDAWDLLIDRIDSLNLILRSYQALVHEMRRDVLDLVERTLRGIEDAETDRWKVGASIIGAIAGVAGAAIGGPGGLVLFGSIAASLVGGGVAVAIEAKGADSELGVIVQCVDAGEGMLHLIDVERAKIEQALRDLATGVSAKMLTEVRPDRPLLITSPDFRPETFGLQDHVQGRHRVPTDTRDLVPEPTRRANGPFDQTTVDGQTQDRYPEQGPVA